MTQSSSSPPAFATLPERAVITVSGPDWRAFLQGLISQDVETLAADELRYGALLTPQGRLLYDLFLFGFEDGVRLDVPAEHRDVLLGRLKLYRLRAKVELDATGEAVGALFPAHPGDPDPVGWR